MPSFTSDDALDLLFDPNLIPNEVRKVLAEGLHVSSKLTLYRVKQLNLRA
jgi:hypothetical protein